MNTRRFRKSINQIPAWHEPYKVLDYMWSQLNKQIQGRFRGRRFKVIFICCTASSNTIITLINRKMICMRKTRNYKLFNIPTAAGTQISCWENRTQTLRNFTLKLQIDWTFGSYKPSDRVPTTPITSTVELVSLYLVRVWVLGLKEFDIWLPHTKRIRSWAHFIKMVYM